MKTMKSIKTLALTTGLLVAASGVARAEDVGYRGWGPRVGVTMDPDQVHFGAHIDSGNLARHIRLQPNVEVGIGDDLTLVALIRGGLPVQFPLGRLDALSGRWTLDPVRG
jgi:hypothetical protein